MRITKLVVAIGIVSALVLAGGITAGLILARDQAPPAAAPMASEAAVPPPGAPAETGLTAMPETGPVTVLETGPTVAPKNELAVMPGPGPKAAAETGPVSVLETSPVATPAHELAVIPEPDPAATPGPELVVMPEPDPKAAPEPQVGLPPEGAKSEMEGASQGTVYTWQDGDKTRRVVLQTAPPAQAQDTVAASEDGTVNREGTSSSIRSQPETAADGQPVFRSESGGGLMTLPGGVLLALDPEWDQAAVEKFFSQNGISMDRTSELDYIDNGFFVETEPGFPSLELANTLAGQDGVILSSPNWTREMESR